MILIWMTELDFLLLGDKDKEEGSEGKGEEGRREKLLEGTYRDHQEQLSDHFRANQELKNVTEGIIQMLSKH